LATSKAEAEERVLRCWDKALIVRSGEFFGPWDGSGFLSQVLSTLQAGGECTIMGEARLTPAYLPDVVHRALDLLIDGEHGIWHLANQGGISRGEFARGAAVRAGLASRVVVVHEPTGTSKELASERGPLLPPLASALDRFFLERRPS
jgi:dTDP-4-dehydrorhamnose reductase